MAITRQQLKQFVEGSETRVARAFDYVIQALIILSLVTFALETLPDLTATSRTALQVLETVTVLIFTVEYVLRIVVADRPLTFVFGFYGLVDLAAILPFYLATGVDLRSIRAVRLFRLVRVFKLARYNAAIRRFGEAFRIAREELVLFLGGSALLLYLAAVGIYYFEHNAQPDAFSSVFDALWWAVATLTTVGYGDVYPVTAGGKVFTGVILFLGLGIVAVPAGLVASALSQARMLESHRKAGDASESSAGVAGER